MATETTRSVSKVKDARCSECPFFQDKKHQLVPNFGPKNPKLIVVGEGPGFNEMRQRKPFVGESGQLIRAVVANNDLDPDKDVFYANATLCWPARNTNKSKMLDKAMPACNPHLKYTLSRFPDDIPVLALGKYAQQALGLSTQEYLEPDKLTGKPALATWHPAYILRGGHGRMVNLERSVSKLRRLPLTHPYPAEKPFEIDPYPLPDLNRNWSRVCVDTEATSLVWKEGRIFLVGLAADTGERWIFTDKSIKQPEFHAWMRALFSHHGSIIGGHNFKFDVLYMARQFGVELVVGWDTMLMSSCDHEYFHKGLKELSTFWLNAPDYESSLVKEGFNQLNARKKADLKQLRGARKNLRLKRPKEHHFKQIEATYEKFGVGNLTGVLEKIEELQARKFDYSDLDRDLSIEYLLCDVDYNLALSYKLEEQLKSQGRWEMPYLGHEIPQVNMLLDVEWNGFAVDLEHAAQLEAKIQSQIDLIRDVIEAKTAGVIANPNSRDQVGEYLFKTLRRPVKKRTPKGAASVDETVLWDNDDLPVIQAVQYYRRLSTIKGSYLSNLPELSHLDKSGVRRVHPGFRTEKAVTHRLSAQRPAIQTITKKDEHKDKTPEWLKPYGVADAEEWGEEIKKTYVAPPGKVLLRADGRGWEMWVAVAMCRMFGTPELFLEQAINEGRDPHGELCDMLFGPGWTKADRTREKNIYFGRQYRGHPYALHMETGIDLDLVEQVVAKLDKELTGLHGLWDILYNKAVETGIINVPFFNYDIHFDLYLDKLKRNFEKNTINYLVQGVGSMIISRAAFTALPEIKRLDGHIVALVHDDGTVEVPIDNAAQAAEVLGNSVIQAAKDVYPNLNWQVEYSVGYNWGSMEPVELEDLKMVENFLR